MTKLTNKTTNNTKAEPVIYFEGVGRRKEAVARVRVYAIGTNESVYVNNKEIKRGDYLVNGKPITKIFSADFEQRIYMRPLEILEATDLPVTVKVVGGGRSGQLDAIVHGLARALVKFNPDYKAQLKKAGLLTRDSRVRERRKAGTGGRARHKKQSPKR